MKPRPSFASTLLTAEPTARLLWWPEKQHLERQTLARLKWLVMMSQGQAWLILDPAEEESPTGDELTAALKTAGVDVGRPVSLGRGEHAVPVVLSV